jgi:hypothetical protein
MEYLVPFFFVFSKTKINILDAMMTMAFCCCQTYLTGKIKKEKKTTNFLKFVTFSCKSVAWIGSTFPSQQFDDDKNDSQENDECKTEADAKGQIGGRNGRGCLGYRFGSVQHDGVKAH